MSLQSTVKEHYKALETKNLELWNEFNAELARRQKFNSFIRNVCNNPKKSLQRIDWITGSLMIKYLGFTQENFDSNTVPALHQNRVELKPGRANEVREAA